MGPTCWVVRSPTHGGADGCWRPTIFVRRCDAPDGAVWARRRSKPYGAREAAERVDFARPAFALWIALWIFVSQILDLQHVCKSCTKDVITTHHENMPPTVQGRHQPYHVLANVQPPIYSAQGILPWRVAVARPDGTVFNTVHRVRVDDGVTVSDLIGQQRQATDGTTVVVLGLAAWQPGQPMPPVVVIEADCNRGKSYAVHRRMIRQLLLANPRLPMLHISVRITHAYDLFETVKKHYVTDAGVPIPGVDMVLYKEGGDEGVKKRCLEATQLVISPEQIAVGNLGDIGRFNGGVLVLDEAVSFALSLGKESRGTISNPQYVVQTLQALANIMPYVIVMDRDMTLAPIGSRLLPCVTPDRDVHHFQLMRPGQRNALCYTFSTKKHAEAGRGGPLATQRLTLQLAECKRSFDPQINADDGSPKGPPEWHRLLIAVATKKMGETAIVPLLKQMGFTPEQYLFYHGESPDAMKRALEDTNKAWRNVIVIIATTTIEVAINIEHNFHARWLFTSSHGQFVSLSSELMQLLARVPRGVDPSARAEQLTDHRIYVLFDGNHPNVSQPDPQGAAARCAAHKRSLDQSGTELEEEERRAAAARLALTGIPSATPAPRGGNALNMLKAAVQDCRNLHTGKVHVDRFFEIAAKNGFEQAEEMKKLSDAEKVQLATIRTGMQDTAAVMEAEAAALFPNNGMDEEAVEKYANDNPTDVAKRYHLLERYLEHVRIDNNVGGALTTIEELRDAFCDDCFGLHPKQQSREYTALEKLQLSIFYSQRDFILVTDRDNLSWFAARAAQLSAPPADADDGDDPPEPVSPGFVYSWFVEEQRGAKRLARLRVLSLEQIRAADAEKGEKPHAKHREVELPEGVVASKYHELFGRLRIFQSLVPVATGQPLDWLVHGIGMEDRTLVQGADGCAWLEAHNRLVGNAYGVDVDQQRYDTQLRQQVKELVKTLPSVNTRQWAQVSLVTAFQRAMEPLGLICFADEVSRTVGGARKKLIKSVEISAYNCASKLGQISLADAVRIYVPGDGDQRYVRADEYAMVMRRAKNQRRMQRRDQGFSDSEAGSPDRPVLPAPMNVEVQPLPFDPLRRWEAVDARALAVTLTDALEDKQPRDAAIDAIDARISTLYSRIATPAITTELQQLDGWRKALYKMADMQAVLSAIDGHFGEEETGMKRWLRVPYEKASLGRTYARASTVEMRLFDGADDPAQKQKMRSLGYQGMHSELRAVLGGRFLHDIDIKKAFANLVVNIARRKGWLHLIPQIAILPCPSHALGPSHLPVSPSFHALLTLSLARRPDAAGGGPDPGMR